MSLPARAFWLFADVAVPCAVGVGLLGWVAYKFTWERVGALTKAQS